VALRLRALVLLVFVAVSASGATAWLTLREADRQVRDSAAADRQDVLRITAGLRALVLADGSWDGTAGLVTRLSRETRQRIRVVSDTGTVLADSDLLSGHPARPVTGLPVTVDGAPTLRLPAGNGLPENAFVTISAVSRYRAGHDYATCLQRANAPVQRYLDDVGVPLVREPAGGPGTACRLAGSVVDDSQVTRLADVCRQPGAAATGCLQRFFNRELLDLLPGPVQVYVGAVGTATPRFAFLPVLAVAGAVAMLIVLAALLLSRSVMRPISRLTEAAAEVGSGRLGARVPVAGRDEMAVLAASFNHMADSLQAAEERQRQLISDVAHELRTPLSNLRGYLEALRDGVLEPTPELIASLHEEVLLQRRLVDDLQELALAEAGALTYHWAPTDLGDVAHSCRTAMLPLAEAAGVRLIVDVDDDIDGPVVKRADSDRIRQVLTNLVNNAVRVTPAGGEVRITVSGTPDQATVEVADTGPGISPEDVSHVFERFWRADRARGRHSGGSGLGLAVARQIVLDHGGSITAESTVGSGSVFTIRLPQHAPASS